MIRHATFGHHQNLRCCADDPAGNSFVEGPEAAAGRDPLLSVEHYDRTPEQSREIGLSTGADVSTANDGPAVTGRVVRVGCTLSFVATVGSTGAHVS